MPSTAKKHRWSSAGRGRWSQLLEPSHLEHLFTNCNRTMPSMHSDAPDAGAIGGLFFNLTRGREVPMPLKLNVGLSKKVGESNYGSRGANLNLELEVEGSLVSEPTKLQER